MILTSENAIKMLEDAEQTTTDFGWIKHSKCVARAAGVIAKALELDIDKAMALGYIHDIGKREGDFKRTRI